MVRLLGVGLEPADLQLMIAMGSRLCRKSRIDQFCGNAVGGGLFPTGRRLP